MRPKTISILVFTLATLSSLCACNTESDQAQALNQSASSIYTGSGSVTLDWMPPTENTDGTPLTNLAGYHIYFGIEDGRYTEQIVIHNPGIATYVIDNLAVNTYYFVATACNDAGIQSPYSDVAIKVVDQTH